MRAWFVPPVVVPAMFAILIVAVVLLR